MERGNGIWYNISKRIIVGGFIMGTRLENRKKTFKFIVALLSATATLIWALFFVWMLCKNSTSSDVMELTEGWQVSVNGQQLAQEEALADYKFSHLQVGDEVVLKGSFPEDMPLHQTMTFLCYLSTIDVEINGRQIYHYGQEYAKKNWLVGSGYHFVDLPEDASGKDVVITLSVREPDAFTNITNPTITATSEVYREFARQHLLSSFVGIFLILLGAFMTIVSAVAVCYSKVYVRLLYIGIFSFLMGIWSMCNMKVFEIFKIDLASNTTVEYLTLYLAPISFILMIAQTRKHEAEWKQQLAYASATLMGIFFAVSTILHFMNIEHYPRFLGYFHLFGGISLFLVVLTEYDKERKRDRSEKALHIGVVILCVSVAIDLVRFNLHKYVMQDNELLTISIIPVGTLLFIDMLVVSYIFYVYGILVHEAEQEWLADRAYHDELCGTYNRTKCNERFDELDAGNTEYALINMDLNGLKTINDSLGHVQGDLLLQEFAAILQKAFSGIGEVFRMGGDEFLVLICEKQFPQIDQCLNKMVRLEKRRSSELTFHIEAAYGVAKSSECPKEGIQKVYMLADKRMYDMKTKQKINQRLR